MGVCGNYSLVGYLRKTILGAKLWEHRTASELLVIPPQQIKRSQLPHKSSGRYNLAADKIRFIYFETFFFCISTHAILRRGTFDVSQNINISEKVSRRVSDHITKTPSPHDISKKGGLFSATFWLGRLNGSFGRYGSLPIQQKYHSHNSTDLG